MKLKVLIAFMAIFSFIMSDFRVSNSTTIQRLENGFNGSGKVAAQKVTPPPTEVSKTPAEATKDGQILKNILSIAFLPLTLLTGCENGTTGGTITRPPTVNPPTPPVTVTKDVSVGFPAFSAGSTLSFEPLYTPAIAGGGFEASDVTYTVMCAELSKTYDSGTGFTANISDGYDNFNTYTFTQAFKDSAGKVIGSQVIKVAVLGGNFATLKDAAGNNLSPQQIPAVNLTLSKEVQQ